MTDSNPGSASMPVALRYIAYATAALMPISINIEKFVGAKSKTYLSPLELLLPILVLALIVDVVQKKRWSQLSLPALGSVLWAGLAILSVAWIGSTGSTTTWARGAFNPVAYGLVASWVFQNLGASAVELRRMMILLLGSFAVCLLLALKQYVGPVGLPFDPTQPAQELGGASHVRVAGWYEFRGIFGALAAMLAPAAAAFALYEKDSSVRITAAALAVVALCVTLAAGGFIGAVVGVAAVIAVVLALVPWNKAALAAVAVLAIVVVVVLPRLPRKNDQVLLRGVAMYADSEGRKQPTARLRRYQAALDLLGAPRDPNNPASRANWQTGVGSGHFGDKVKMFYQPPYSRSPTRTDSEADFDMEASEPFTFGFFETVTVELGVPGLLAVLLLFGTWGASALSAFVATRNDETSEWRLIALASFGACAGAFTVSIFADPLIKGVGGSFAFFLGVALAARKACER